MGKKRGFSVLKKQGINEKCYAVPQQLTATTGIQMITESGIIKRDDSYEKVYCCEENTAAASNVEKIRGCTMLLRNADVDFAFYEDCMAQKVFLLIRFAAKGIEEAGEAFRVLEGDMQGNLYTFGIVLRPLDADGELRNIHRLAMSDTPGSRMDINHYVEKQSGWLPDLELKNRVEEKRWLRVTDNEELRRVFYVRRMSSGDAADICRLVRASAACRLLITCYEPVEDRFVAARIRQEYFSADNLFAHLERKNHGIGRILGSDRENERRYVFAGIYFVLGAENEEKLQAAEQELTEGLGRYRCEVAAFPGEQKSAYRQLLTFRPWAPVKMNLMPAQDIVQMNPFYRETAGNHAEVKEADAFLHFFDSMT